MSCCMSIAHCEPLAQMLQLLDFIYHGYGVVFEGNTTAVFSRQQLVFAEPKLAGSLAGHEQGRGRQEGPVEFVGRFEKIKERRPLQCLVFVLGGEVRLIDKTFAQRNLKAASPANDQVTL